jgi:hypothetical protein
MTRLPILELTESMSVTDTRDPWGDTQRILARKQARLAGQTYVAGYVRRREA